MDNNQKYGILGWRFFIKDLKSIPLLKKLLLICAGLFLTLTSLINFGSDFNQVNWFWNAQEPLFQKIMQGLSGIVAFAGIVNVYLVGVGKISNYIWGLIGVTTYGIFAFSVAYTGDAILNLLFFLPFQFVGFFYWKNYMAKVNVIKAQKMTWIDYSWSLMLASLLFIGFWFLIPWADEWLHRIIWNDKNYVYPFDSSLSKWFKGQGYVAHACDALTDSLSILASIWMLKRFREQWFLWISVNCLQFFMFTGLNGFGLNIPILIMWSIFFTNSVYAMRVWYTKIAMK